jgi:hypothetical protein
LESLLALFVHVDDFCKVFLPFWNRQLLSCGARQRQRERSLSLSEIMTILIAFHQSHYRDFKAYYYEQVLKHWRSEFPCLIIYNRFIEFIPSALVPLCAYFQQFCLGSLDNEMGLGGNPNDPFPSWLSLYLAGLGIRHNFIRSHQPTDQPQVERSHRTLDGLTDDERSRQDLSHLQQALDQERHQYNHQFPSRASDCAGQPPLQAHPALLQPRRPYLKSTRYGGQWYAWPKGVKHA